MHTHAAAGRPSATLATHAYVDREWSEDRIQQRCEWLFTYDATIVEV